MKPSGVELPRAKVTGNFWGSNCWGAGSKFRTQDLLGSGLAKVYFQKILAPIVSTLWDQPVGGTIVNKEVQIFKHRLFYLRPFASHQLSEVSLCPAAPKCLSGGQSLAIPSSGHTCWCRLWTRKDSLKKPHLKDGLHPELESHPSHGGEAGHFITCCLNNNKKRTVLELETAWFIFRKKWYINKPSKSQSWRRPNCIELGKKLWKGQPQDFLC